MQPVVLQRYLGNKNKLIDDILTVVESLADPGDTVFDAFSGTLSVSMALKQHGYRVISNDINLFSWAYGRAYLTNSAYPKLKLAALNVPKLTSNSWSSLIAHLTAPYEKQFPHKYKRKDFYDHYTEAGKKSAFKSSRGAKGKRRFFTPQNAILIDRALSRIRFWAKNDLLDEVSISILTTVLLSAIERVSNTQGTYHDFPRDFYDRRAEQPLELKLPEVSSFNGKSNHILGKGRDTLEFVKSVPAHKVIYIDPPYNFRQYTSYYFLPNLVAAYPYIENLDEYFDAIQYVRGQNMNDDFKSTFCSTKNFMPSLKELIASAKCKYVVMSYFDGKNHWSDFKSKRDKEGFEALSAFFSGPMFKKGTFKCVPVDRLNYQSYGGHKAEIVREYLFIAEKC